MLGDYNPTGCGACEHNATWIDSRPGHIEVTKCKCKHPAAPPNEDLVLARQNVRPYWCPKLNEVKMTCQTIY